MLVDVPRWSLLLFVIVFAALAALVASERRAQTEPQPSRRRRPRPATTSRRGSPPTCARSSGSRPSTAARAPPARPGDAATADYIEQRLRAAGYRVTRQRFRVPYYRESAPPRLTAGGRRVRPVRTLQFSPGGRASGARARGRARLRARRLRARCARARSRSCGAGRASSASRRSTPSAPARPPCSWSTRASGRSPARSQRPGLRIPALALGAAAGDGLAGRRATVTVRAVSRAARDGQRDRRDRPRRTRRAW